MVNTQVQKTLAATLAAVPLPMILVNGQDRIDWANPAAGGLFGDGLVGHSYATLLRQPDLLAVIGATRRLGVPHSRAYLHSTPQGESRFRVSCAPCPDLAGQAGVLVSFEDISHLEDASRMRQDFVANVSHELRTPLTALLGFIETLRGAARDDAEARERFLAIMEAEATRMNRLVQDLLSLSRVETQERTPPAAQVDLARLLSACVQALAPIARAGAVTIDFTPPPGEFFVQGDDDQLQQVFRNLIENAIKYGCGTGNGAKNGAKNKTENKAENKTEIRIILMRDDTTLRAPGLRVEVIDQGEGIAPRHLPRLTERFYRIDAHRSREMGGTGLGLAIVKHIVSRHRGRLQITSTPGRGSRFSVILPQVTP